MKITYIAHSGFMMELEKSGFLFDYYYGEIPKPDKTKKLYVCSSHRHGDHFNPEVLELTKEYPKCHFLLSYDIEPLVGEKLASDQVTYIKPGDEVQMEDLTVKVYDSTDEGVSFAFFTEGRSFFHAGDLHWWTWIGEETQEEYEEMTRRYQEEIEKVKKDSYEVVFTPLDPRQGEREDWGLTYFLEHVQAGTVFPMHCQTEYDIIERYCEKHPENAGKIVKITGEGDEFVLK